VYSKKVEYLYQLVHHTLDILSTQKAAGSKGARRDASASALAEDEAGFKEAASSFLLLEDYIKEGKDIDLAEQLEYNPALHGYGTRAAAGQMAAMQHSSSTNPQMAALLKEDRGASFRMNSCHVHASGALVIGTAARGGGINSSLDALVSPMLGAWPGSSGAYGLSAGKGALAAGSPGYAHNNDDLDDNSMGGHDDGDWGGGFGGSDDEGDAPEAQNQSIFGKSPALTRGAAAAAARGGHSVHLALGDKQAPAAPRTFDPWATLDPHDDAAERPRPCNRGKTFKVPTLNDPGALSTLLQDSGAVTSAASEAALTAPGVTNRSSSGAIGGGGGGTGSGLMGLAFPEFDYVLKRDKSRVLAANRQARMAARVAYASAPAYGSDDDADAGYGVDFGVSDGYGYGGGDDDDDGDDNYGAGGDDYGVGFDPNTLLGSQHSPSRYDGESNDRGYGDNDDEGLVAPLALDEAFAKGPKSYAELCRAHIASFSRGADRYAHNSNLSRRVSEWQDKLGPVLDEQNARRPFDIHAYGGEVLSAASAECAAAKQRNAAAVAKSKGKLLVDTLAAAHAEEREDESQVSFGVVGRGRESYDICRLFLAALQLSNNGNVVLHHPVGEVCGPDSFKLEVLSTVTSQDRFDNYLAPSLSH